MSFLKSGRVGSYKLTGRLGEGSSGEVYSAISEHGKVVVLKIMHLKNPWRKKEFEREVNSLTKCASCPLIVRLIDVIKIQKYGILVLEKLDQDLLDFLQANQPLSISLVKHLFFQICVSVLFLHKNCIAHLDIKPENIFFAGTDTVKLGDFGSSYHWKNDFEFKFGAVGTSFYCAPEVNPNHPYDPSKADIWSLGILLHVLLTGFWPFQGKTETALNENVKAGNISLFVKSLPDDSKLYSLLNQMLNVNPRTRYSIKEVLSSSWLCNEESTAHDQDISCDDTSCTLSETISEAPVNEFDEEEEDEILVSEDNTGVFTFSDEELNDSEIFEEFSVDKPVNGHLDSIKEIDTSFGFPNSLPDLLTVEKMKLPRYVKNKIDITNNNDPVIISASKSSPTAANINIPPSSSSSASLPIVASPPTGKKKRRPSFINFFHLKIGRSGSSPDKKDRI